MTGHRLARLSLRIDAIYCIALGVLVAATAPFTAGSVALPLPVLVAIGALTAAWGGYVWWSHVHRPIRQATQFVMVANIAASLALAATGLFAGEWVLALAASVLAIDVAAFAVSQGIALRLPARG
ncbi:hypothetical protein [Leucobacter musarum]|uniref:hypothetical protein n=1 Tax=Leucobacter musarum TaxID=1930747 RepID=UPI0006A7E179|nr:hypothetical protein [Leucobacter musarum]